MNNFYIITNETKDHDHKVTDYIKNYLESRGKNCPAALEQIDCVLVLGGDGTMLRAANELAHLNVPFLGINLGTLGFLAEVDKNHIEQALEQIINNKYAIEKRMMINGTIENEENVLYKSSALNDIVITGHKPMQLIYFDLYVNDLRLNSYIADGMIISTPTGSTGYNLSAGGPIIESRANAILLTPLCAHSMQSRSIILSSDDEVKIKIGVDKYNNEQMVNAVFDGQHQAMKTGDQIVITKSEKTTSVIRFSKMNFLELLKQKLRGS
ncbi:MAG: NAD(+)/NADH kinase [Lachnospiraceae bacterium]|nr:NAD(+)/NADH kinase [Lachnospiraceae bacterium]